jgi:hypothetical protein
MDISKMNMTCKTKDKLINKQKQLAHTYMRPGIWIITEAQIEQYHIMNSDYVCKGAVVCMVTEIRNARVWTSCLLHIPS